MEKVFRTELTPLSFLRRSAAVFPDRTAVVHGDRRYSYRQFEERTDRLAQALLAANLRPGDRVAVLAPNIPALLEAHYGVPAAGGVLVAINTRLSSKEVGHVLQHSGALFLLVDAELAHLIEPLDTSGLHVVRVEDSGESSDPYEAFLADASPDRPPPWLDDEEKTISINYTSGTTGRPKGVMYSHRGAYLNALGEVITASMTLDTVYLWTLPMFHCNGWCFTWAVTAIAGRHVCLRKVDSGRIWELIASEGVTHYNGAPTIHVGVVNHPSAGRLERPVTLTVAGAPPSPTLLGQLDALNFRLVHVYGLTETYGPYTVCDPQEGWAELSAEDRSRLLARQGQTTSLPIGYGSSTIRWTTSPATAKPWARSPCGATT